MKRVQAAIFALFLFPCMTVLAVDSDAVLGGAIGGGVGAAIGSELGGREGAIVGSGVGAAIERDFDLTVLGVHCVGLIEK